MSIPFNHIYYLDNLILFALYGFVVLASICRVNALDERHSVSWSITYIFMGAFSLASMVYLGVNLDPDWFSYSMCGIAGMGSAFHIIATWRRWRGDPPQYMEKEL